MSEFKARKTIYKGIEMRSRLEAGFAAWLDQHRFEWQYEPQAFGSEHGQYLPDFRIEGLRWAHDLINTRRTYVEVKPPGDDDYDVARRMLVIRASEPDAGLLIVRPEPRGYVSIVATDGEAAPVPIAGQWVAVGFLDDGTPVVGVAVPIVNGAPWPDGYWNVT